PTTYVLNAYHWAVRVSPWRSTLRRRDAIRMLSGSMVPLVPLVLGWSPGIAKAEPTQWDPTLPRRVSAGAPGDPVAIANASLQATRIATETTLDLGRRFLGRLGIGNAQPGAAVLGQNRVHGRQAIA